MARFFLRFVLSMILSFVALTVKGQSQDFESLFSIVSYPQEFLPGWFGNDVRNTSTRIFQLPNLGRGSSRALAVQPISTFNGEVWIRINPAEFENPTISFWARSLQSGTGNRPAVVYFSWGESLTGSFSSRTILESETEFGNENQEFRRFLIQVPQEWRNAKEVYLKIEVLYGPGSGSAARWLLDDFQVGDFVQDLIPPKVASLKGYSSNEVFLAFDEPIDPVFSLFPIAYELDGLEPDGVYSLNDSTVVVRFEEDLEEGKNYKLNISQIPDLEGNFMGDTTVTFRFTDPTAFNYKSLVINELMPAPRVDQDLPNVEYIELFNPNEKEFRLLGLKFSNSRSSTSLTEYWIQPGEYVLLAPSNQSNLLRDYGSVVPVNSWPTMLNSGDVMSLTSSLGGLIDQVGYSASSWGGSEFANGGYSLEVINPFFLCDNSEFIRPSTDPIRGTPGRQNSIFSIEASVEELKIESAFFVSPDLVDLGFNQPFFPKINSNQVAFSPELRVDSVWVSSSRRGFQIKLAEPARPSQKYQVKISSLATCDGGLIGDPISTEVVLTERAEQGELIINEVLFDARAGDPKFVEIYNTTDKYLSLDSWALANLDDSGLPDQVRIFGARGSFLEPGGYLAISTDSNRLRLAYPKSLDGRILQISSLSSYPISGGTVVLISHKGEIMEKFTYDPKMHHPLIRNTKGVSLERISSTTPVDVSSNWQSASGIEDYATPGRKNSTSLSGEFQSNLIKIYPQVFDPEGSFGPAFTTIQYELDQPGWVGSFSIYSSSGLLVQNLAQNQILGTSGLLTWNGIDNLGARVRPGYYVLLVELFDLNGKISIVKKTIVVALKL